MASASSSSSCQAEGEDVVCKNDIFTFHPFARLPPELRHKIWLEYLTSSGAAPQIFRFKLRWPPRAAYRLKRTDLRAGDQIFLQPSPFGREPNQSLQALRLPIAARQIASATCMESRQAVIDLYPDTLKFRYLPVGWMSDNSMKGVYLGSPDGAGCPEHILRFNGAKDIVILDAAWEDQEAAIEIAESRGSPPDEFLKMCHVGIRVNDFKFRHNWVRNLWRTRRKDCQCTTEDCNDHCKKEPLSAFLALFPRLKTFYIAGIPTSGSRPLDQTQVGEHPPADFNCPCPNGQARHSWPIIQGSDAFTWLVIYDERSGCSIPKFDRIERIRQRWRPQFPYYRALEHLEIKFIQSWDPNSEQGMESLRL